LAGERTSEDVGAQSAPPSVARLQKGPNV